MLIGRLTRICGKGLISPKSSLAFLPLSSKHALTCSALTSPSPVLAKSLNTICPLCSPPKFKPRSFIISSTFLSPTAERLSLILCAFRYSSRAALLITVATISSFFSSFCLFRCVASTPIKASPWTTSPFSSTTTSLSASPSKPKPISARKCLTCRAKLFG